MSILDDLATLPVNAEFDVPVNDDTYQDPTPPAPLKEGNYRLRIVKFNLDKRQDGTPNLTDGKWPVVNLERVEVVEPAELAGRVALTFERVYSKPFNRNGGQASGLADIVRSHDQSAGFRSAGEGIEALARLVDAGGTFRARIGWEGYDKDHYEAQIASIGGEGVAQPEQKKAFRKQATIKGMKNFPAQADGSYSSVAIGKSGATVEAKARISGYFPSAQEKVSGL